MISPLSDSPFGASTPFPHQRSKQQLLCCADKLSNIKNIYVDQLLLGDDVFKRFNAPKEKIRWYYESIANALTKIEGYKMKQQYVALVKAVFSTAQPTQ